MITQILGVALISLLNITPTLQQNNLEQLIAPNIEIQDNLFLTSNPNAIWVENQFSYYIDGQYSGYTDSQLKTSFNTVINLGGGDNTALSSGGDLFRNIYIVESNFYFYRSDANINISGTELRDVINAYYTRTKGTITSSSFSFTITTSNIANSNYFYTYSINGTGGLMEGRVYNTNYQLMSPQGFPPLAKVNSTVSYPLGTSLESVINQIQPSLVLTYSDNRYDEKPLYYYMLDTNGNVVGLPTSQGTHTRDLYVITNYGQRRSTRVTLVVGAPDTTPPTITSINGNSTNWINQDITLTVQATDNVALNSLAYSFDNGANYQASNSKTFTTNEIVNISVRDSSNNVANQSVTINRIDKQSPSIVLAGNWKNTFELGELANNQALLSYLSISDGASGLNNGLTSITNFNYNQAGSYSNIQVSATDNAGNTNVFTLPTVSITQPADTTGPIITGPTIINVIEGNILTQSILDSYSISDISGIEPNTISIRDLNNNVITNWESYTVGSYQLRVYARDTLNNITQYQFTLQVGEAPLPDLTPPTIVGPLLVSFEIGTYTSNTEILNLYTFSDNVGILQNQLIGEINYSEFGDYPVTIRSTDTSNNVTNRNVVVRIRDEVVLGNYNPLTDLLSGIFGGALSMIFTIGTINVLGLRLLDAMGVIILGAVLLFVYKAIKGGS
jgi:hypothetical protein